MKYSFPAIFKEDESDKEYINVEFPDLMGIVTCGKGIDDAIAMAKDCLESVIGIDYIRNTQPSTLEKVKETFPQYTVMMIEVEG